MSNITQTWEGSKEPSCTVVLGKNENLLNFGTVTF